MNGRVIALLLAVGIGVMMFSNSSKSSHEDVTVTQDHTLLHDLWLKVKKIEALVTLMQEEKPVAESSEPLRDHHLVPIHNISQVTQPAPPPSFTPGMEPAKQPVQSQAPVQKAALGHVEYRGFRGRRSVWVQEQSTGAVNSGTGFQSRPVLGAPVRFFRGVFGGGCRGGACGS